MSCTASRSIRKLQVQKTKGFPSRNCRSTDHQRAIGSSALASAGKTGVTGPPTTCACVRARSASSATSQSGEGHSSSSIIATKRAPSASARANTVLRAAEIPGVVSTTKCNASPAAACALGGKRGDRRISAVIVDDHERDRPRQSYRRDRDTVDQPRHPLRPAEGAEADDPVTSGHHRFPYADPRRMPDQRPTDQVVRWCRRPQGRHGATKRHRKCRPA